LKKLVEDKPKRQFRGDEMKKAPVLFRLVLFFVTLAGGLALYSVTRGAQTPSLAAAPADAQVKVIISDLTGSAGSPHCKRQGRRQRR
jgi:hypothetical protein